MVEQTFAAARSLAQEADELAELVSRFSVGIGKVVTLLMAAGVNGFGLKAVAIGSAPHQAGTTQSLSVTAARPAPPRCLSWGRARKRTVSAISRSAPHRQPRRKRALRWAPIRRQRQNSRVRLAGIRWPIRSTLSRWERSTPSAASSISRRARPRRMRSTSANSTARWPGWGAAAARASRRTTRLAARPLWPRASRLSPADTARRQPTGAAPPPHRALTASRVDVGRPRSGNLPELLGATLAMATAGTRWHPTAWQPASTPANRSRPMPCSIGSITIGARWRSRWVSNCAIDRMARSWPAIRGCSNRAW